MKKYGEKNLDLLQNIEFAIVEAFRGDPSILDIDVQDAVDALTRHYHAEEEQRTPPSLGVSERAQRVFASVQEICEWRLGRAAFRGKTVETGAGVPVAELVRSLREIQKSIPRWSRRGGRRGYLEFIQQYLP